MDTLFNQKHTIWQRHVVELEDLLQDTFPFHANVLKCKKSRTRNCKKIKIILALK